MSDDRSPNRPAPPLAEGSIPVEIEDLTLLARRYCDQGMYDEAIHLYEMASKLRPGSVALRIDLARARDLKEQSDEIRHGEMRDTIMLERARAEIDAAQYVGLAQFYMSKNQTSKAIELLEMAKLATPNSYRPYHILSNLYFLEGEWELAHDEVNRARRFNPFDRGLAELAGRIRFEIKDLDGALNDFIDAFLLSTDHKGESSESVRRMINTVKRMLDLGTRDLNNRIKERGEALQANTQRLELRKDAAFKEIQPSDVEEIRGKVERDLLRQKLSQTVAQSLRRLDAFKHMKDEQLVRMSKFVKLLHLAQGEYLFRENDRSMDFFLVKEGMLEVRKDTPFGPQLLARIDKDQILGEMNFVDRMQRSTDSVAISPAVCYSFSFSAVDLITEEERDLAVGLHWAFWRSLAEKVRDANEQLKLFFREDAEKGGGRKRVESKRETQQVRVASEDKVGLFRERGLSAGEMKLLATFSTEERFRTGSPIFREGEAGDKLYIVLEGRVRISKFIPGVGEEALAVLDRGDFFGEMALIDDMPRSADAKAHEADATVLSIDRATLNEILSMDPAASLQFLSLLCRMLSRRLREINDKIVQWKYMSGGF